MARSPYLLFKRVLSRKIIYYCKIWQPAQGKYTTAKSCAVLAEELGVDGKAWPPSAKAGARHIAEAWLAARGGVSRKNDPLLWEYCRDFWTWETSGYIRGKLERGQQIGRSHANNSKYRITEYIQPRTQGIHLREVTAETLDRLQLQLRKELPKQSAKSINMMMSAVTTAIREAYRLGQIPQNPAHKFRALANNSKQRGILSTAEILKLFETPWDFESYRMAAAVGFCTGARLGEILALTAGDLDVDFEGLPVVWIRKSWSFIEGQKPTKTGNVRVVPISAALRDDLIKLAAGNPHGNGLIFWGPGADKPLTARMTEHGFNKQLEKIGIDEAARKTRALSFHSTRHIFNSTLRGKVDDGTLRLATGHADPQMTDHYDHLTDTRLKDIRKAQAKNILIFQDKGRLKKLSDFYKNRLTIAAPDRTFKIPIQTNARKRKEGGVVLTKLLSYSQAAELLGVSHVSIKRYVSSGILPVVRFSKRMVKIPLDKLEAVIKAGGIKAYAKKGA